MRAAFALVVLGLACAVAARPAGPSAPAKPAATKDASRKTKPSDPLVAQPLDAPPLAIVGATIHPVVGDVIEDGILLLRGGRIEALLPAGRRVPAGYEVLDAQGRHAWPGLVALGADGLGLASDAWQGSPDGLLDRGLAESFDPWADSVELAASGGITSALVYRLHGAARGPLSGRAAVLKMSVREPRGALLLESAAVVASSALLGPEGRHRFHEQLETARKRSAKPPKPGSLAALMRRVASGDARILAGPDAAGDILSLLELAEHEDVKLLLLTPVEAWPLAETLAEHDVAVAQNVRFTWGRPTGNRRTSLPGGARPDAAARLLHAGVPVGVLPASDTIVVWGVGGRDLLDLPLEAAFAQRGGMTEQEAIEAITIGPARILGVDDRVGSLERGKDADVILTDGDLLDYRTLVRTTIVNGRVAFDAATSRWWKGIAALRDEALKSGSQQPPATR